MATNQGLAPQIQPFFDSLWPPMSRKSIDMCSWSLWQGNNSCQNLWYQSTSSHDNGWICLVRCGHNDDLKLLAQGRNFTWPPRSLAISALIHDGAKMAPMESDVHARDVEKQVKSGLDDLVAREYFSRQIEWTQFSAQPRRRISLLDGSEQ